MAKHRFVPPPPFAAWMYQEFLRLAGLPFDYTMLTFGGMLAPDAVCVECGARCDVGAMSERGFLCAMPCTPY